MDKKTKIVATVGPASKDVGVLKGMIEVGVNVFRFNLKHGTIDWHREAIKMCRQASSELGKHVSVMVDLAGPEMRFETKDGQNVELEMEEEVVIAPEYVDGRKCLKFKYREVLETCHIGQKIFIDSGVVELEIVFTRNGLVIAKAMEKCIIKNKKSISFVGSHGANLPSISKVDKEMVEGLKDEEVDLVALSYCREKSDVENLKKYLEENSLGWGVVSKLENKKSLDNMVEIIEASDGVMVARGDLGVEVAMREIVFWQKKIIEMCRQLDKPVIVATQMMESMINNPRPTRAEVSDVSNAVFDGADAVMLSGETAVGKYPVKVVSEMSSIVIFCETKKEYKEIEKIADDWSEVIVKAVVKMTNNLGKFNPNRVIVFTKSGRTARILSSYDLRIPIVAVCDSIQVLSKLELCGGVVPYLKNLGEGEFRLNGQFMNELIEKELIKKGETLIVVHGQNWLLKSSTNALAILEVA